MFILEIFSSYIGGETMEETILELREDEDFFPFSEMDLEEILNFINN